jgi:HNH endonuclease
MQSYFKLPNFRQFIGTRREIRLPLEMLCDARFRALRDEAKAHVICLLLLAARYDNRLPDDVLLLSAWMGATNPIELDEFRRLGLIEDLPPDPLPLRREGTRYIPNPLRARVIVRDGGRCRRCGNACQLEVDHITPLSRGGSSEEDNLQTLCRRCNRRKQNRHVASL